jgi:hypothetical protein
VSHLAQRQVLLVEKLIYSVHVTIQKVQRRNLLQDEQHYIKNLKCLRLLQSQYEPCNLTLSKQIIANKKKAHPRTKFVEGGGGEDDTAEVTTTIFTEMM